jgi:hypothetical protein
VKRRPPAVDSTEREQKPVPSPADSLAPLDTDPSLRLPQETRDARPPVATLDTEEDALPRSLATSTTQLLDDEVAAGPTLDLLPPVACPSPESPAAPHAPPKKAAPPPGRFEANSAPVARKAPRRRLLGKEDQFESAEPAAPGDVPETPQGPGRRARLTPLDAALAAGAALVIALLAWLLW